MNSATQQAVPESGIDGSSQTWQNQGVEIYGSTIDPPWSSGLGRWTGQDLNTPAFVVRTWTSDRLPGPVGNSTWEICESTPTLLEKVELQKSQYLEATEGVTIHRSWHHHHQLWFTVEALQHSHGPQFPRILLQLLARIGDQSWLLPIFSQRKMSVGTEQRMKKRWEGERLWKGAAKPLCQVIVRKT